MSEIIRKIREIVGNKLNTATKGKESRYEQTEEEKLAYVKRLFITLCPELHEPVKMVLNKQSFWFDFYGMEATDKENIARYETFLGNEELGLKARNTAESRTQWLKSVQDTAKRIGRETRLPVKINDTWFDRQGTLITEDNVEFFEENFG